MSYILLALIGVVFSSISTAVDKFIVDKWFDSSSSAAFTAALPKMVIALSILVYLKPSVSIEFLFLGLAASILYYSSYLVSFSVLQKRDVTKLQPLSALSNVFVVVISAVILGRLISIQEYLGVFLITIGSFIALMVRVEGRIDISRTTGYYLFGVLLVALFSIVSDYSVSSGQALIFYGIYDSLGAFILSPVLIKENIRNEVKEFVFNFNKISKLLILKSFASASIIFYFLALSQGPVEVVASIFTLSSIGVLIIIELLRRKGLNLENNTSKIAYLKKISAIVLAVIGLIILKISV